MSVGHRTMLTASRARAASPRRALLTPLAGGSVGAFQHQCSRVISLTPTARCPCETLGMQTNDHQQDWRARAEEMRAIGNQMHDQLAREEMLRLANKYERLAAWTEELSPLLRQ